jgi:biotin carboxylase
MKDAILIVSAGMMQLPAIRTAKALGLTVVASDGNPKAVGLAEADVPLVMDTKDVEGHVRWARDNGAKVGLKGAFAAADVAITVAAVTEALGFPGVSLETARASNNKWLMKQRWLAAGVPTPYGKEVKTIDEARAVVQRIGLPAMVKAIDNAASRGSRRIDRLEELPAALEDAIMHSSTRSGFVEEFIEGPEHSVDIVFDRGRAVRFGVVDRIFGFWPYPIELGHLNPSVLPAATQEALLDLTERGARALGIEDGPCKSDAILTRKGPMLLELPARLSGGWHSQYTTPLATGQDPIGAAISLAVGRPMPPEAARVSKNRFALCKALFPPPGRVRRIAGIDAARTLPGVEQIFMMVSEGSSIRPYQNCADRVCYVIVTGKTREEAEQRFAAVEGTLTIETAA